jgi:hypothetical protein
VLAHVRRVIIEHEHRALDRLGRQHARAVDVLTQLGDVHQAHELAPDRIGHEQANGVATDIDGGDVGHEKHELRARLYH